MAVWVFVSLLAFALLHSIMASLRFKKLVRQRWGERAYLGWYRFVYNAVSGITFLPVMAILAFAYGPVIWRISGIGIAVLAALQLVSGLGLLYAATQFDGLRFVGVRQVWAYLRGDPLPLPPEPFIQHGMYGLVRHPLYSCIIVMLWAVPVMRAGHLAFALAATIYFIVGALLEERRMIAEMDDTYLRYRQRVPFLIPFVHLPPAACCVRDMVR